MFRLFVSALCAIASFHVVAIPAKSPWQEMNVVGEAKLRVALWDIYSATLFAENEAFDENAPFVLKLTYLRSVKEQRLLKETSKQWRHLGLEKSQTSDWIQQLENIWRDVDESEVITLFVDDQQYAHFYINNDYAGSIKDKEFSRYFSGIWLSPDTSRPKMRKRLLGVS